jgi:hypothetical protein
VPYTYDLYWGYASGGPSISVAAGHSVTGRS